jgi:hypothetical protein
MTDKHIQHAKYGTWLSLQFAADLVQAKGIAPAFK